MSDGKAFLDTNVFIYMYDASQPDRKEVSLSLLDTNDCITSTQAINEISNVLLRKLKKPFSEVMQVLEDIYLVCEVKLVQKATFLYAIGLMERYGFSYYDCLMLASAMK
ncbi:MAG: PIN domain-containing protein [Synergistaceae bacterium]|nr:PIN domain-containing protein [Synergistaceae bacterium]